jgi:hypothetical protein
MLKRKNINISETLNDWYVEKANEMGVSQSAIMAMALQYYKDTQETLKLGNQIPGILKEMTRMQEEIKIKGGE